MKASVFELNKIVDDPRFEGFGLVKSPSVLGRGSLRDDLSPGVGADKSINWAQPRLAKKWKPPKVVGRVTEFNDYPCIGLILPAFSERAVNALREFLEPNGELLPLKSSTTTKFYAYNILTISDALDVAKSTCDFWCDPPTTAIDIEHFVFKQEKLEVMSIFRLREFPASVFVTSQFVEKVNFFGLSGMSFKKVWPLSPRVNWRMQPTSAKKPNRLKKESLIIILPFEQTVKQKRYIKKFEDLLDSILVIKSQSDSYFGSYEGAEVVKDQYRMYFSAPNGKKLFRRIEPQIRSFKSESDVTVYIRKGGIYDAQADEERLVIQYLD